MPAKPLSKEQLEDAYRLRQIYDRLRLQGIAPSQEELAFICGWKTQGAVYQYISGKIPLNPKALIKFSKALRVDPEEISPELSKYIVDLDKEIALERNWRERKTQSNSDGYIVAATKPPRLLREHFESIDFQSTRLPFLTEQFLKSERTVAINVLAAVASMGNGDALSYEGDQIIDVLPVSKAWLERNVKAKPDNLRVITGAGDSMHPTFSDGDMLLVDISRAKVDVDGVYVLSAHERLFIKRVRQRMDGTFEVSSDNPTVKTVDILNGDHEIRVHGRVVWAWNGRAL